MQIPLIWYIVVADWFTRTEITYIQVTLPPYLKLRETFDFVFSISQGSTKT